MMGVIIQGHVKGMLKMISESDVLDHYKAGNSTFPTEIMNWYYNNDQDTFIILWNQQNEIIYVSQQIENYFDYNVKDVMGKKWTTLLPDDHVKKINTHFELNNNKLHLPNISVTSKQEKVYSFYGIVDKVQIEGKYLYICKLRNVTYVNELKQVLLDSEKLVLAGQLSAGLVHEIRNPLTSLKGFLQLIQAGVQQKEEYYKVMIGEIDKLEKITYELLQMAKPFKSNKKNESIHTLIDDVLFIMQNQSDMRKVQFMTEFDDGLSTYCNASQIKQVLINIIKNAAEAMKECGTIKIQTRSENGFAAIDIIDEGQGIPEELINQLNNPFFTTKPEGTGLGLVITQHILDLHQGELTVQKNTEKGTTFTINLPLSTNE